MTNYTAFNHRVNKLCKINGTFVGVLGFDVKKSMVNLLQVILQNAEFGLFHSKIFIETCLNFLTCSPLVFLLQVLVYLSVRGQGHRGIFSNTVLLGKGKPTFGYFQHLQTICYLMLLYFAMNLIPCSAYNYMFSTSYMLCSSNVVHRSMSDSHFVKLFLVSFEPLCTTLNSKL